MAQGGTRLQKLREKIKKNCYCGLPCGHILCFRAIRYSRFNAMVAFVHAIPIISRFEEKTTQGCIPREGSSRHMKYLSLVILIVQNALLIISMRYSRLVEGSMYFTSTAVVFSEFIKMVVCLSIILVQQGSLLKCLHHLHEALIVNWMDTLKMSIPAIVYMIQNNLQYVAVSNLDAAVFQVTYQLKILTTAIFSVVILRKELTYLKWGSLAILFVGVALVQVQSISSSGQQNHVVGVIAVIISCFSSGFAGVYFEMMLKGSNASLWLRNVQLGMFGSITALLGMVIKDGVQISNKGIFFGYSYLVWFVISQQAIGGLIVAVVVRYADNILKGFATSFSIILSCLASVYLFEYHLTVNFIIGAALVILAIYLYGTAKNVSTVPTVLQTTPKEPAIQIGETVSSTKVVSGE